MNLERLERFVFLATLKDEAGLPNLNVSHAAELLGIPQSYLSRQIKQLETELGIQLFLRGRNKLKDLTPYGKAFLQQAESILGQLKQIERSAQQASQGEVGRLSVGVNTSISNSLLPQILQAFRQRFPKVELVLLELLSEEGRQRLIDRTIDVDFANLYNIQYGFQGLSTANELTYHIIREEPLVMVLPDRHPLAHKPDLMLQDLAAESFIMPPHHLVPALHTFMRMACLEAGFHPQVVQEVTWMTTILAVVSGGMGVALLPANVMHLQRTGVVYRQIPGSQPVFKMAVVWRRDNPSKILGNFVEVVRSVSQNLSG